jgi:hypothetical protein
LGCHFWNNHFWKVKWRKNVVFFGHILLHFDHCF